MRHYAYPRWSRLWGGQPTFAAPRADLGKPSVSRAPHLLLVRRGASSLRRCADLFLSLKWSAALPMSSTLHLASQFAACQERTQKELLRQEGEHRQAAASKRCAARCRARRCPSRARGWDTHTACSPLLLVLASQVPNSSLNPPRRLALRHLRGSQCGCGQRDGASRRAL